MNSRFYIFSFLLFLFYISCNESRDIKLFTLLTPESTGVTFNNKITESDKFNILKYEYIYNGGGVALADFNNDGLDDIFFSGNMVSNELYINKGNLQFDNITQKAGIKSTRWCTGVNVVDINQDGKKDIFVTVTANLQSKDSRDLLYINESIGKDIRFSEKAFEYGLADSSYSTNAAFFDYDNDGDLDMYLLNNRMEVNDVTRYSLIKNDKRSGKVDKLFRNDFDKAKNHPYFTDVSDQAGVTIEGYSLGVSVCDINLDGWQDLYISNDFLSNNILFINNKNGTFSNKLTDCLEHTSYSEMGNDVVDINNDGLQDIVGLDMLPYDNFRRKTMMGANNYFTYQSNNDFAYTHQFVRNTLQLNRGIGKKGLPSFSDIACMSGIEATDWSWAPLIADFDADGLRDIIITNGFPRDITDKDFADYRAEYKGFKTDDEFLEKIPEVKLKNFAFRNKGNLKFDNVTDDWGITQPTFSNGAAYSDLDNDGDIDYVINNINDIAHIYKNNAADNSKINFIKINLSAQSPNRDAIGTVINYSTKSIQSTYQHNNGRGYLSTKTNTIYIGLGADTLVDLEIIWPGGMQQKIPKLACNKTYNFTFDPSKCSVYKYALLPIDALLTEDNIVANDTIFEYDYIDYNTDPLLLKKLSNLGPGIAVGDVNGDDLDDYYVTGGKGINGKLYLQTAKGFKSRDMVEIPRDHEEVSPLLLDIDGDKDLDLYIGCGSNEFNENDAKLKDVLLLNDGRGKFTNVTDLLPVPLTSTACVKANDFDDDGDLDLFIGGRSINTKYPQAEKSFLLLNESKPNAVSFKIEKSFFESQPIMVSDAIWTDYNNDDKTDLIIVGEYSSIQIYKNIDNVLVWQSSTGLEKYAGLYNSINGADLDQDGDIDYVVGNYGSNSLIRASEEYPITVYAKDFEQNGSFDFIPSIYLPDRNGKMIQTSYHVKGDLIKEMIGYRKKFINYSKHALSPMDSIVTPAMQKGAMIIKANNLESSIVINLGGGKFEMRPLPRLAQVAPIYGSHIEDFNNDGLLDIMVVGNNFGSEMTTGRLDAGKGLLLLGNKDLTFTETQNLNLSGDTRSLSTINIGGKYNVYVVSKFKAGLKSMKRIEKDDYIFLNYKVKKYKILDVNDQQVLFGENYIGNGFQGQKSRYIKKPKNGLRVKFLNGGKEI